MSWRGRFGTEYIDRNPMAPEEMDALYVERFGVTRRDMDVDFVGTLPATASFLEVGCNVGTQLRILRGLGYRELAGCDVNAAAIRRGRRLCAKDAPAIDLFRSDAADVKCVDSAFDVVFTSGLLIHIAPEHLPTVMAEMYRVSKRYVWGMEYYAPELTEIPYRDGMGCWKGPYWRLFAETLDMRVVQTRTYPYRDGSGCADMMYLLEKGMP